jgi:glycosyltransferase involved in cell wall biosynthesis
MLVVIETHPIQYHAPLYRLVQEVHGIPVTAIYGSDFSTSGYRDAEFGTSFAWDTDLLSGYTAVFLSSVAQGGAASADDATTHGLRDVLRDLAPSAVMTVGYSPRFHRDAWLAALWIGCPIFFRGETNDEAVDRSWLKQIGRDAALRAAYSTCSRLLFVGARSREHFERLGVGGERLVFSPYCVDASVFETSEADRVGHRRAIRGELGVSEDQILLLFSGKLSQRKGVDLLVEAVDRLPVDTRSKLVLAFLGDGALRADLERRATQSPGVRVAFLGFKNQRQLSPYYHACDLLVLPSRQSETWGLVVNEALHHGVPCVVSDKVGCGPDLIDHGRTGYVFSTGSAYALAGALQNTLGLIGREDVRHACRTKVAGYSTERAAAGIAEAYAGVIGAGKAA